MGFASTLIDAPWRQVGRSLKFAGFISGVCHWRRQPTLFLGAVSLSSGASCRVAESGITLSCIAFGFRKIIREAQPRQFHIPVGVGLRLESFRTVQKTNRDIKLVVEPLVQVADGSPAVGAKRPNDALRFRK